MTTGIIPFSNKQASGQEELAASSPLATNVIQEETGAVFRRPGIGAYAGAVTSVVDASGINGVYSTLSGQLIAVAASASGDRPIYMVTGGGAVSLSADPGAGLAGSNMPVFAETEMLLVIAGGAYLQKVVLSTRQSSRLGGNPPRSTHVVASSSRLIANDAFVDRTKVRYSDVAIGTTSYAGHETWDVGLSAAGQITTAGYFTAEANPDPVVAVSECVGELFVHGSKTLQLFNPDAGSIFAPTQTRTRGCVAPYSVIEIDQAFAWLDDKRQFVVSDGRSENVISGPIKGTLDKIATVTDCYGYRVVLGSYDFYCWRFPTDGRTFAYQVGGGWSTWSGWQSSNWAPFLVMSHCRALDGSEIVGLTDGRVGALSLASSTDFGVPFNAEVVTGFLSRQTDARKWCRCVRLALRRGDGAATPGPQALLSFRDRPGDPWVDIPVDMGSSGDTETVLEFRSLGIYRRRQWKFEFLGATTFTLVSATEEFDVLSQ